MSKINQSVYGTVPTTQYSIINCPKTVLDLYNDGNFDPSGNCEGGFEKSISPWGIGGGMTGDWFTINAQRSANGRYARLRMDTMESYNKPISFWNASLDISPYASKKTTRNRIAGNCFKATNQNIESNGSTELGLTLVGINRVNSPYGKLEYNNSCIHPYYVSITRNETASDGKLIPRGAFTVEQIDSFGEDWFEDSFEMVAFTWGLSMYNSRQGAPNQWEATSIAPVPTKAAKAGEMYKALALEDNNNPNTFYDDIIVSAPNVCGAYDDIGSRLGYPRSCYVSNDYIKLISNKFTNTTHADYCSDGAGRLFGVGNGNKHVFDDVSYHYEIRFFVELNGNFTEITEGELILTAQQLWILPYYKIDETTYSSKWESLKAIIRHELAFIGFPFAMSVNKRGFIGSNDVSVPVFDSHMITTGNYLTGAAAQQLPNAQWGDIFDDTMPEYDPDYEPDTPGPGPGPRPKPDPNPNPIYPSTPSFTLAGKGTTCYALRDGDMDDILAAVFGREESDWDDLLNGLKFYGADPMAAIISYKWYPFTFNPTPEATVRLGGVEVSSTLYSYFTNVSDTLKTDSFTFWAGLDKNFINSRHTVARLWLPFYGFYSLPIQNFISEELEVEFHYNVPDELGVWIISFGDVIYDFVECNPSIDIPLSAIDYRGQKYAQIGSVINYGSSAINGLSGLASGIASIATGGSLGLGGLETMRSENGYGSIGSMLKAQGVAGTMTAFDSDQVGTRSALIQGAGMFGSGVSQSFNSLGGAVTGIANNYINTRRTLNQLAINVPLHGAAGTTTFLNLPMAPYVQVFRNIVIDDYNEGQYKLKNGHACDKWVTAASMPSNSLCQTSGIADIDTSGMELREVQELNSILQNGFFIAIE